MLTTVMCALTTSSLPPSILSSHYPLDLTELVKKPHEGFSAGLIDEDDLYKWEILIIGPPDTF